LGVLTCTPSASHSFSAVGSRSSSLVPAARSSTGQYWALPSLQSVNDGTPDSNADGSINIDEGDDDGDDDDEWIDVPSFEEAAPFPPSFYTYLGYFMVCAYNPSAFKSADDANAPYHHNGGNHPKEPPPTSHLQH